MKLFKISLISLLLYLAYVPTTYSVTARTPIYGEVGKKIILPCPSGGTDPNVKRSWSRGSFDKNNPPPVDELIYKTKGDKKEEGKMYRSDMTFDKSTFAMTLTVQNNPSDNGNFTCVIEDFNDEYDVQEVLIFLQPLVTIETDRRPEEGVNVTVTCRVERLYPNITSDRFTMTWGSREAQDIKFSGFQNDDGSMKYILEKTKNLTQEDEGVKVECAVTPMDNFGNKATASMVLNITMGPEGPSDPAPKTDGGSNVGAIVGGVIGGLAAVIIVVIIMVVILTKKKAKKDTTTRQSAAKGSRTKTNKPVSEELQSEGLMYADLDLVNQRTGHRVEHEGSRPPVAPRPVQEPTEYAQIDFDKLRIEKQRDEEDLSLSNKEEL